MEWWQWLVLAVPAVVLLVSVTMIIRILTGAHQTAKSAPATAPSTPIDTPEMADTDDPEITWTRPDPLTVESAGFSDQDNITEIKNSQKYKVSGAEDGHNHRVHEEPAPARGKGEPIDPGDAKPRRVAT